MKKKYEEIDGSFYYFGYYEPFYMNEDPHYRNDFDDEDDFELEEDEEDDTDL